MSASTLINALIAVLFLVRETSSCYGALRFRDTRKKPQRGMLRLFAVWKARLLPATASNANADAGSVNADCGAIVVMTVVTMSTATTIVIVAVALNDHTTLPAFTPASTGLIADHADILDTVINRHRGGMKRGGARATYE